jgi:hypothetical protein
MYAVFALSGRFDATIGGGPLGADFDPLTGPGSGIVNVYVRDTSPGGQGFIDASNPDTWVPAGVTLLGTFNLVPRPTAIEQGAPGGVLTDDVVGFNPNDINTAFTSDQVGEGGRAAVKASYDPTSGTFFDFTGLIENPADPTIIAQLDERLEINIAQLLLATGGVAKLEALYAALTGGGDFTPGGDPFNPLAPAATGDTSQLIQGDFAIPGSQIVQVIPEPTSLLAFTLLLGGGLGARVLRRRLAKR